MQPTSQSEPATPVSGPLRVLIADDEPNIVRLLVRICERRGHEVVAAGSAQEALQALDGGTFDVVLVDLHMPGGGMTVVRRLEGDASFEGRVVLMTGSLAVDPSLETGPSVSRLQKPFRMPDVIAVVEGAGPH